MTHFRRAQQCPHPGCSEWAVFAIDEDVRDGDVVLWRCPAGHRGPHVRAVGPEAGSG